MFEIWHSEIAYSVVKFMVNVKLMENSVNNHVGKVMVVNVTSESSAPRMTLRQESRRRPQACTSPPLGSSLLRRISALDGVAVLPSAAVEYRRFASRLAFMGGLGRDAIMHNQSRAAQPRDEVDRF